MELKQSFVWKASWRQHHLGRESVIQIVACRTFWVESIMKTASCRMRKCHSERKGSCRIKDTKIHILTLCRDTCALRHFRGAHAYTSTLRNELTRLFSVPAGSRHKWRVHTLALCCDAQPHKRDRRTRTCKSGRWNQGGALRRFSIALCSNGRSYWGSWNFGEAWGGCRCSWHRKYVFGYWCSCRMLVFMSVICVCVWWEFG